MTGEKWWSVFIGFLMAMSGAAETWLAEQATGYTFEEWTPLVVALFSFLTNLLRKFVEPNVVKVAAFWLVAMLLLSTLGCMDARAVTRGMGQYGTLWERGSQFKSQHGEGCVVVDRGCGREFFLAEFVGNRVLLHRGCGVTEEVDPSAVTWFCKGRKLPAGDLSQCQCPAMKTGPPAACK